MGGTGDAKPAASAAVEEDPNAAVVCSSPPCFMHELDPAYLGYLRPEEVSALLVGLLAANWGGVAPEADRLRAALRRHLEASGAGAEKAEPPGCGPDRLAQVVWETLPRIHDHALRRDLEEALGVLDRDGSLPRDDAPAARADRR